MADNEGLSEQEAEKVDIALKSQEIDVRGLLKKLGKPKKVNLCP